MADTPDGCRDEFPNQRQVTYSGGPLLVAGLVHLEDDGATEKRWTATVKVGWQAWPTGAVRPPDKADQIQLANRHGAETTIDDWTGVSWPAGTFRTGDAYQASVRFDISREERAWESSASFDERCNRIRTVQLTLR